MKIALALIVKPTDDEAVVLRRCLENVSPHVDGIFLTFAGPEGVKNESCETVAKLFKAETSYFTWINDFAAARNASAMSVT